MFSLLPSRSASQIKCGFSHTLLNEDEDVEVDEDLEQFASYHGVTWEEFTVFDSDLATSMTIEEDWERNLVASCSNAEDDCLASSDEYGNNQDDASAPTISSRVAVNYLRDALFHKNQELQDYFTQSQVIVEQTFSQNNTTQTKLPDIAPVTNELNTEAI